MIWIIGYMTSFFWYSETLISTHNSQLFIMIPDPNYNTCTVFFRETLIIAHRFPIILMPGKFPGQSKTVNSPFLKECAHFAWSLELCEVLLKNAICIRKVLSRSRKPLSLQNYPVFITVHHAMYGSKSSCTFSVKTIPKHFGIFHWYRWHFQQYLAPCHTPRKMRTFLKTQNYMH